MFGEAEHRDMEDAEGYNIRFRHVCGDFGPFLFPKASTVMTLKEKLLEEWAKGKSLGDLQC